ncbi:MAG: family 43 glycosylhydrolase, partial [Oscillospiraceae bacterium]|nr:family 43 glycosylhydrolase [Oscillospiraceae bacterium]
MRGVKHIGRWLLVLALLLSMAAMLAVTAEPEIPFRVLYGNVSLKGGDIIIEDARLLLQHLVDKITLNATQLKVASVTTGNGHPTIADARLILQYIVGKVDAFPVGEYCYTDTPDPSRRAGNPIITSGFTADPSAHIWLDYDGGERLWLYPSTDVFPANGCDRMDQYHVYSTDNMVDWVDHGEIIRRDNIPTSFGEHHEDAFFMWAPDAAYNPNAAGGTGPYFYYFPHATGPLSNWGSTWKIFVAHSDSPYKGFKDNGFVTLKDRNGNEIVSGSGSSRIDLIDPCVFLDEDGTYYMVTGGGGQCRIARLAPNMTQLAEDWTVLSQRSDNKLSSYDKLPNYHEGPWMFYRYNDFGQKIYYLMYPGGIGGRGDDMLYAVSTTGPKGLWEYKGSILKPTGTGDTSHGSMVEFKGRWYIFYHNAELGAGNLRSVCVDEITFNPDGTINPAEQTTAGVPAVGAPADKAKLDAKFGAGNWTLEEKYQPGGLTADGYSEEQRYNASSADCIV